MAHYIIFLSFSQHHQGATKDEESTFTAEVKLSVEGSWIGTILYIVPWNPTT